MFPPVKNVCLPISKARWKAGSDSQGNFVAGWGGLGEQGDNGGGKGGRRVRKNLAQTERGTSFTQPMQGVQ